MPLLTVQAVLYSVSCVVGDGRFLAPILQSMSMRLRSTKSHHSPAGELERLQVSCPSPARPSCVCACPYILLSCRSLLGREHAAWFEQARAQCGGLAHTHSCGAIASSRKTGPRKAARPPLAVRSRHRLSVSHRLLAQLRLRLWHRAPTLWHRALTLPNALRLGLSLGQGMEA